FVPVGLGLGLFGRRQDELRDLAKALRLLLFHGINPHPYRGHKLARTGAKYHPARTRSGGRVALLPLRPETRSLGAELAADVVSVALGPALQELSELGIWRLRQHHAQLHILIADSVTGTRG